MGMKIILVFSFSVPSEEENYTTTSPSRKFYDKFLKKIPFNNPLRSCSRRWRFQDKDSPFHPTADAKETRRDWLDFVYECMPTVPILDCR
mmetsp:Transcript_1257/g.2881  ORF Transcript_1257/g.2881 Transcript_1257/m.2881 type:complete len:90 (-) Transcript_1257:367-636(-)